MLPSGKDLFTKLGQDQTGPFNNAIQDHLSALLADRAVYHWQSPEINALVASFCSKDCGGRSQAAAFWPTLPVTRRPTWENDREKIMENLGKAFWVKLKNKRRNERRLHGPGTEQVHPRPSDLLGPSSPSDIEDDTTISTPTASNSSSSKRISTTTAPRLARSFSDQCVEHIKLLDARKDKHVAKMSRSWLEATQAPWPKEIDIPLTRLMHEHNVYSKADVDDNYTKIRQVVNGLLAGTVIQSLVSNRLDNVIIENIDIIAGDLRKRGLLRLNNSSLLRKTPTFETHWNDKLSIWELSPKKQSEATNTSHVFQENEIATIRHQQTRSLGQSRPPLSLEYETTRQDPKASSVGMRRLVSEETEGRLHKRPKRAAAPRSFDDEAVITKISNLAHAYHSAPSLKNPAWLDMLKREQVSREEFTAWESNTTEHLHRADASSESHTSPRISPDPVQPGLNGVVATTIGSLTATNAEAAEITPNHPQSLSYSDTAATSMSQESRKSHLPTPSPGPSSPAFFYAQPYPSSLPRSGMTPLSETAMINSPSFHIAADPQPSTLRSYSPPPIASDPEQEILSSAQVSEAEPQQFHFRMRSGASLIPYAILRSVLSKRTSVSVSELSTRILHFSFGDEIVQDTLKGVWDYWNTLETKHDVFDVFL